VGIVARPIGLLGVPNNAFNDFGRSWDGCETGGLMLAVDLTDSTS